MKNFLGSEVDANHTSNGKGAALAPRFSVLDRERELSMADEGSASAASLEGHSAAKKSLQPPTRSPFSFLLDPKVIVASSLVILTLSYALYKRKRSHKFF